MHSCYRLETLATLKDKGVETLLLDVTDRDSTEKAFQQVVSTAGRIDILICNAGSLFSGLRGTLKRCADCPRLTVTAFSAGIAATAPLAEQRVEDIERIFQTNAFGVLRAVQVHATP